MYSLILFSAQNRQISYSIYDQRDFPTLNLYLFESPEPLLLELFLAAHL